jgi:hypothetical protein
MVAPSFDKPVHIPILVGVTGKRKSRLEQLGVMEEPVRTKLRQAFALVDELAPSSPKILLCGMADGVDEIAATLVIGPNEQDLDRREFRDWSIVGLLPMPEEAFLDDFGAGGWWYHALDARHRHLIRLMPLQTLAKPLPDQEGWSTLKRYTSDDLRRPRAGSNPVRTAHYEQLGMVLAERSTILIAVMPEDEEPDRPGGTAYVVAHRLNGWRPAWPPVLSRDITARSSEIVSPAPLATPVANEVWLVPIGVPRNEVDPIDLRLLRPRKEFDPPWPAPLLSQRNARQTIVGRQPDRDVLIRDGHRRWQAARSCCPLLRSIEAFNRRAANTPPRPLPVWDHTIQTYPDEPARWSPLAATERLRGSLAEIQRNRKRRVGRTASWLAIIASVSIAILELYAEFFDTGWATFLRFVPLAYVALIVGAVLLYYNAVRKSWPAVAEDYRLVAEALRVQIVWWRIGLIARRDRVDNVILRYDTGEFQLLRRGLATVLDAVRISHAKLTPPATDHLPDRVIKWIDNEDERNRGQIQYHRETAENRKRRYGKNEFSAWSMFGISLGAAVWLALFTFVNMLGYRHEAKNWLSGISPHWLIPALGIAAGFVLLVVLGVKDIHSPDRAFKAPHILGSWLAGICLWAAVAAFWAVQGLDPDWLRKLLFLGSVIMLAWAGIIRYRTEKIAIEAEAQGSETANPVYTRAKAALDEVEKNFTGAEAVQRREEIIRDLGEFALAETEGWLRSHRERPLHPALG